MFKEPSHLIAIKRTCWIWFKSQILIHTSRMVFLSVNVYILLISHEVYRNGIDLQFVLSYGGSTFAYIFYLIVSFTYITQEEMIYNMEKYMRENFRPLSSRGKTIKGSIIEKMRIGKYVALVQIFCSVCSSISLLPTNSDRSGIMLIIMLMKRANLSRGIEIFFHIHYIVVHFFCFQFVYCYVNLMLYCVLHLHFQYLLLIEDCRRLENGLDSSRSSERDLNEYHSIIERRLASILSHYQVVDRYQILVADLFRRPVFFEVWFGLIALMFVSYLLFKVDLGPDFYLVFIVWLSIIEVALLFVVYGQLYANQKEELWGFLMDFQWFNWNRRNKRTYQMLLNYVNEERLIKAGGLIALDSTFLIWFGRKTISAVAFLSTIEEHNSTQ